MSLPDVSPGIPNAPVRPGDLVAGKYEVEKVLAAGGMGVVISAHHRQLKRRVALKFLLPELCATPGIVERFLREAQAMTAIQSEHVARVLDVGTTDDGSPYMVMEYLEGEDLGQTLERRDRLPSLEAVDFVLQAMEALAEAHVNGFVHRDLKPSNLFVIQRPDGTALVKVLDFGISKALSEKDDDAKLTKTQAMLGSPLYMAPEQIRSSASVDIRADIWTLGIILHELIAGHSPFNGNNVAAVLAAIIGDDPASLKSVRPDAPDGLTEVILKCLRRNRDDRYANLADLATALLPFAPRQSRISVDRINKTLARHERSSSPDLGAKTNLNLALAVAPSNRPPVLELALTAAAPPSDSGSQPRLPSSTSDAGGDSTFGKYKLIAFIGQGGMADVFLAVLGGPEGLGFSKLVVIKRLRSGLAGDREFVSMLVDEARIAARLNHPNVVQTHEVGVVDDQYYIAMEYLEGQPLHHIQARATADDPLPLAFRLGIVRDLLAGVHHAHELLDFDGSLLGLVHRDLSPQNIFVTYDGQVKVVDFGIAKVKGRSSETQQGVLKGKVRYMSPEQAAGQDIDRGTDVFAAGVVLWELLTGQRMWAGLDDVAIIQKLLLDKIPSSARDANPTVPKALDAIVKKALARKRTDRYDTAQELQLDIERYMEAQSLKCSPREVGEWVAKRFADRRKQARSLIDGQLSKLRAAESSSSFRVVRLGESSASAGRSSEPRLERLDRDPVPEDGPSRPTGLARSNPGQTAASGSWSRPRSRPVLVGGAALLLVAVAVGVVARRRPNEHATVQRIAVEPVTKTPASSLPAESAVVTAAPPSAAAPEGLVRVSLSASTPGAEFAIDGEPRAPSPVLQTQPRDTRIHRITVTAPGHTPETKMVKFDSEVVWSPRLVPIRTATGTAATAIAAPSASTASTAPQASVGARKRNLDPENPYSGQ